MASTAGAGKLDRTSSGNAVERSWRLYTSLMLVVVWLAVLLVSVFAPDLVSGSEQEHLPVASFTTWLWGAAGTAAVLLTMTKLRGDAKARPIWIGYAAVVIGIWVLTAALALALPDFETGSDPTNIPLAALLAPVAAAVLTGLAGIVATVFRHAPSRR